MTLTLAKPTLLDLLRISRDARPDEIEQYEALFAEEWDYEKFAIDHYNAAGVKFVLLDGNRPIQIGGFTPILPGVEHGWMVGTMENWEAHWRSITKVTRRVMDNMLANGSRRLQCGVLSTRTKTCEWYMRGLKMEYEGSYKQFGAGGETMDMYARTKE